MFYKLSSFAQVDNELEEEAHEEHHRGGGNNEKTIQEKIIRNAIAVDMWVNYVEWVEWLVSAIFIILIIVNCFMTFNISSYLTRELDEEWDWCLSVFLYIN